MAWGLLDDKFHRHPKVRAVRREGARGREALGVWVYWWAWCLDDEAQNGIVPREELSAGDLKAAALLEDKKLWDPVPDGWYIHDFHDYLNGAKQIRDEKKEAKRKADRERVAAIRATSRVDVANVARDTGDNPATVADEDCDMSRSVDASVADPSRVPRARAHPLPLPRPIPALSQSASESAFGDIAEGGENPEPPAPVPGWTPQRLARVLDSCVNVANGSRYPYTQRAYTPLSDALDFFASVNPDDPGDVCEYAFKRFWETSDARKASHPVAMFLSAPGLYVDAPL